MAIVVSGSHDFNKRQDIIGHDTISLLLRLFLSNRLAISVCFPSILVFETAAYILPVQQLFIESTKRSRLVSSIGIGGIQTRQ
jgi:hypothetical protein